MTTRVLWFMKGFGSGGLVSGVWCLVTMDRGSHRRKIDQCSHTQNTKRKTTSFRVRSNVCEVYILFLFIAVQVFSRAANSLSSSHRIPNGSNSDTTTTGCLPTKQGLRNLFCPHAEIHTSTIRGWNANEGVGESWWINQHWEPLHTLSVLSGTIKTCQ